MGIIYTGPYADAVHHPRQHEGWLDRRMKDGRFSGGETSAEFSADQGAAWIAACECGWRSHLEHPPTEQGETDARNEWDREHLQPLINAVAVGHPLTGADVLGFITDQRANLPEPLRRAPSAAKPLTIDGEGAR